MYYNSQPCQVCGADVELRAREAPSTAASGRPVGPSDGVVGDADSTVDERVCTNADCPTRTRSDLEP